MADILGRTQQAIGKWEVGKSEPDGATLLKLSAFFNVTTDYLLGKSDNPHGAPAQPTTSAPSYYNDPEVAQMANEIKDNPDMRILFDASRDLKKESIEEVVKFIEFQKAKERGWD